MTGQADMTIVAQATNGREAIQQFRSHHPDVTLMDIQMPEMNGLDALIAIRNESPEARVIMLTTYAGDAQVLRAIKAGAQGYLLKSALHRELLETIRRVHSGKKALSAEVSYEVAEHATDDALTPAEVRVLQLIARGNANKEIAEQLSVTEETVKGSGSQHFLQIGRERPYSRGHDRYETRHHRGVVRSKEAPAGPFGGCVWIAAFVI